MESWGQVAVATTLACLVVVATGQEAGTGGLAYWEDRTSITICTSEYTPIVWCVDRDQADYGGFEIALFKRVQQQLGWQDSQINFTCTDWDTMMASLDAGDGLCDMAVAGVDVTSENFEAGVTLTVPTLSWGYKIMVLQNDKSVELFTFLSAFSLDLWLAMAATCIVIGFVVWIVDRWDLAGETPRPGDPPRFRLQRQIFRALGRPMQTEEYMSASAAASLIILVFSGICLILVTLFTGITAANMTATRLKNSIAGVADLVGKRVGTYEGYVGDLEKRGISTLGYPWDSEADEEVMFEALKSGEILALVLDSNSLDYMAGTRCDLKVLDDIWGVTYQGVAFPKGFNNSRLLKHYNEILLSIAESGDTERLVDAIVKPTAACKTRGVSEEASQLSFHDVVGLWVVLGASIAAALVLLIIHKLARRGARKVRWSGSFQITMQKFQEIRGTLRQWSNAQHEARIAEARAAEDTAGTSEASRGSEQSEKLKETF